jgi:hypothetical protein
LVESGAFDWPEKITVLGNSVWQGRVWFSSPNGSGIYNKYRGKEDMTIEVQMSADDGRTVTGTITCRVMLTYGVNIIKVGNFYFQEGLGLYHAVDVIHAKSMKEEILPSEEYFAGSYITLMREDILLSIVNKRFMTCSGIGLCKMTLLTFLYAKILLEPVLMGSLVIYQGQHQRVEAMTELQRIRLVLLMHPK